MKELQRTELRALRIEVREQEQLIDWLLRQLELRRPVQAASNTNLLKGTTCLRSSN